MYQERGLLFLYSQTPVQPGAGGGAGSIDRPVQREAATSFPLIQASGVRGAVRDCLERQAGGREQAAVLRTVFGNKLKDLDGQQPGSIAFSDAKLLLYPIRQGSGDFIWITCPLALERLARDGGGEWSVARELTGSLAWTDEDYLALPGSRLAAASTLVVGEETFQPVHEAVAGIALHSIVQALADAVFPSEGTGAGCRQLRRKVFNGIDQSAVIVVTDKTFSRLVQTYTQVESRIRINDKTGVVSRGALWREETLPPDMVMYSVVMAAAPCLQTAQLTDGLDGQAVSVLTWLKMRLHSRSFLQIGAGDSIGRGHFLVNCAWPGER